MHGSQSGPEACRPSVLVSSPPGPPRRLAISIPGSERRLASCHAAGPAASQDAQSRATGHSPRRGPPRPFTYNSHGAVLRLCQHPKPLRRRGVTLQPAPGQLHCPHIACNAWRQHGRRLRPPEPRRSERSARRYHRHISLAVPFRAVFLRGR
jgi:hypothetical protein